MESPLHPAWWILLGSAGVALAASLPAWRRRAAPPRRVGSEAAAAPALAGRLEVLPASELYRRAEAVGLVEQLPELTGFDQATFAQHVAPLLDGYAELVQRLPASESHHHAEPGGLLVHALECVCYALRRRRGMTLPRGAAPEDVSAHRHRWTYAVFTAALLHDVGKPLADLRITAFRDTAGRGQAWDPLTGTLLETGSRWYTVDFPPPDQRDYQRHQRLPMMLFQRLVPQPTRHWLGGDATLLPQLAAALGETEAEPGGNVLLELVKLADQDSVSRNLLRGDRTRFASARAVPLIERLMPALRTALQDSARIPLNRRGAAGWVSQGHLWIASKTAADQTRELLQACETRLEGAAGIPADNTRLFDTWAEYGALTPNPDTGLANWTIRVLDAEGQPIHTGLLQVLAFPVDRIWLRPADYPADWNGRIELVQRPATGAGAAVAAPAAATTPPAVAADSCPAVIDTAATVEQPTAVPAGEAVLEGGLATDTAIAAPLPPADAAAATAAPAEPPAAAAPPKAPELAQLRVRAPLPQKKISKPAPAAVPLPLADTAAATAAPAEPPTAAATAVPEAVALPDPLADLQSLLDGMDPPKPTPAVAATSGEAAVASAPPVGDDRFLRPDESASAALPGATVDQMVALRPLRPQIPAGAREVRGRSVPSVAALPPDAALESKTPPPLAALFMHWIQLGLASGELTYNCSGALVHFVPEGLLLISPAVFQRFADLVQQQVLPIELPEDLSGPEVVSWELVQRALARSGWALKLPQRNRYTITYEVVASRKSEGRPKVLHGFVVQQPERWISPVPPPNDALRYVGTAIGTREPAPS